VFGSLKTWNPENLPPDKNPNFIQRLTVVERPPFTSEKWTHVAATWSGLNAPGGSASLYLDGKRVGPAKKIGEAFEWDPSRLAIRLGVNYIGLMDDVAVFDRVLSEKEISSLYLAASR